MARNATIEFVKGLIRPVAMLLVPRLVYRRRLSLYDTECEMDLLPFIVPRGREAVDVGANVGVYSFALSSLASHVYAFEPIPEVSSYISKVLPDNVTVRNLAVSDTIGVSDLFVPFKDGKEDNTPFAHIAEPTDSGGWHCRVQTTTLDTLADYDIGFVKIDVEGHEMNVLRGASELMAKQRPTVLIEAEDRHRENAVQSVFAFFANLNYQGFFVLDGELMAVSKFNSSMQNIVRLKEIDRRKSDYVNNFIFIPAERCEDDLLKAMAITLKDLG
jgi:FkbM family methyltransferase